MILYLTIDLHYRHDRHKIEGYPSVHVPCVRRRERPISSRKSRINIDMWWLTSLKAVNMLGSTYFRCTCVHVTLPWGRVKEAKPYFTVLILRCCHMRGIIDRLHQSCSSILTAWCVHGNYDIIFLFLRFSFIYLIKMDWWKRIEITAFFSCSDYRYLKGISHIPEVWSVSPKVLTGTASKIRKTENIQKTVEKNSRRE